METLAEHSRHFFTTMSKNLGRARNVFKINIGQYGFAIDDVKPGNIVLFCDDFYRTVYSTKMGGREGEQYAFVAESSLYGFMHGEMMDKHLDFCENICFICISWCSD